MKPDHATTPEEMQSAYAYEQLDVEELSETWEWQAILVESEALWLN